MTVVVLRASAAISQPLPLCPNESSHQSEHLARMLRANLHLNSLLTSYLKANQPLRALNLYAHARRTAAFVDNFALPSVLKACAQLSAVKQGMEVHGFAFKSGFYKDIFVYNALMQMYSECGSLGCAEMVFDEMPERDVVSWSTMIRSYARGRCFGEAVDLVEEMLWLGVKPSEIAMINIINLFADVRDVRAGRAMHACLLKNAFCELPGINASTALIDMYGKCGCVKVARKVFDQMSERSTASWSAMIAGYIRCEKLGDAMQLFRQMLDEKFYPNEITMLSLVLEYGLRGVLKMGKWLHCYVLRNGFKISNSLGTALVDMYGKCGDTRSARVLFDQLNSRDTMSWIAIISGYTQAGLLDKSFDIFHQMKEARAELNEVILVNLVSLCAENGALDRGKLVHAYIEKLGIGSGVVLVTALVDMYAKCGEIDEAYTLFSDTTKRDVCMWNAMLSGLAMHGHGNEVIELFSQMQEEGVKPNDVTLIALLHACSHSGLVEKGKEFFDRMEREFRLVPKVEHYGCMVDLLGRAGQLNEAYEMVLKMPVAPNIVVWGALLAACKIHKNPKLVDEVSREVRKLDPSSSGYNVLLSNIYAIQNRWNDVAEVRKAMRDTRVKKTPGLSSVELNGLVHEFVMGDDSHPQSKDIKVMLAEMQKMLKQAGHRVDTSVVLLNIDEEEKETSLAYHSEKLALAFSLINTAPGTPIRIVKNLRVCDDCHAATKILSKIYDRVIIMRDRNRFHRFSEGACSCQDYCKEQLDAALFFDPN
ncbi:pentatricopeptide repeat-containing protein At4g21065-like isoform X2 [Dioscorea cayenensis subsp. rotundata]|uniref:Pentatricopeptide repeat-containing protein At4g21065-like isoform X2 n=1 Tax=Dioscorea cayennensis subsp. rotundata TaxID=55577 RepID=A0AB40CWU1_DIOCR|nr:pentatricopeptide repeat-containing protein At4g21065-like isoform X2 [Dioscorea cayenensis subsp. rotundata]